MSADKSKATLKWSDGQRAPVFSLNPNPNPAPRCPCWVYEADGGRVLTVEHRMGSQIAGVTYEKRN